MNGIAFSGCEKLSGLYCIRFTYTDFDGVCQLLNVWVSSKCFRCGLTALVRRGGLLCEVPRSNSDTLHLVGLLWTIDRPATEPSTWQHTTTTRGRHPRPGGIRIRNTSKRAAADPHLRPRGHWVRLPVNIMLTETLITLLSLGQNIYNPQCRLSWDAFSFILWWTTFQLRGCWRT